MKLTIERSCLVIRNEGWRRYRAADQGTVIAAHELTLQKQLSRRDWCPTGFINGPRIAHANQIIRRLVVSD